jgi:hypothetical protein
MIHRFNRANFMRLRFPLLSGLGVFLLAVLASAFPANSPKFLPDDPIWQDADRMTIPPPGKYDISKGFDLLENTFLSPGGSLNQPAANINTLGEVPDSSWHTNRMSLRQMSVEEVVRGPNQSDGPDLSAPWTINEMKSEGITPGFIIKDAADRTFVVKFDPMKNPQMTTSAEVIGTKFFYAFGYHVPENYLAFISRHQLKVSPKAVFEDQEGRKRKLKEEDVSAVLKKVPKWEDGSMQVMASLFLPGKPAGYFRYHGTRSDDPNDIFPHEDRRELRGLRVFAAWLNHNDSDAANTLEMYVTEGDRKYIKHHLIDFGTVMGSGAHEPHARRAGNEYYLEGKPMMRSAFTLGIWDRPWRYWDFGDYPSIGRFESKHFRPELWRPDYPHPGYLRMQNTDAFWATRTVARFNDDLVRAAVRTGKLADHAAEDYLIKCLIERRDKIIRYYLAQLNPLDEFKIAGRALEFKNLGVVHGLAQVDRYQYQWFRFDNQQNTAQELGAVSSATSSSLPIPDDSSSFLMVRISSISSNQKNWSKKVEVYLRNSSLKSVVGIEREN